MTFVAFPSIGQFKNIVSIAAHTSAMIGRDEEGDPIYDFTLPKPTVTFRCTTKVHGSNTGITRMPDGAILAQSRNQLLAEGADFKGFSSFVKGLSGETVSRLFDGARNGAIAAGISLETISSQPTTIFGEWAGQGIQSGVATANLPKFFYVFAVLVGDQWIDSICIPEIENCRIFNSQIGFPVHSIVIDFNNQLSIAEAQNKLIALTLAVEKECPVGARFGSIGVGEGIVCTRSLGNFKVKGEDHSATKVKTLAAADVATVSGIADFVASTVTNQRVAQAIAALEEKGQVADKKATGEIVRWVIGDVMKEESDTIAANALPEAALNSALAAAARTMYFQMLPK
jgi:hypothetical protein